MLKELTARKVPVWPEIQYYLANPASNSSEGFFCTKNPFSQVSFYLPGYFIWEVNLAHEILGQIVNEPFDLIDIPKNMPIQVRAENQRLTFYLHKTFGDIIIKRLKAKPALRW